MIEEEVEGMLPGDVNEDGEGGYDRIMVSQRCDGSARIGLDWIYPVRGQRIPRLLTHAKRIDSPCWVTPGSEVTQRAQVIRVD